MNRPSSASMLLRAGIFVALVLATSLVLERSELTRTLLHSAQRGVALSAGFTLDLLGLENQIEGTRIASTRGTVKVTDECVGFDISLFLGAAMLVHPALLVRKLTGFGTALLVIGFANWLRVISLAFLVGNRTVFDVAHYYVWPGIILILCLAVFLLWSQRQSGEASLETPAP